MERVDEYGQTWRRFEMVAPFGIIAGEYHVNQGVCVWRLVDAPARTAQQPNVTLDQQPWLDAEGWPKRPYEIVIPPHVAERMAKAAEAMGG